MRNKYNILMLICVGFLLGCKVKPVSIEDYIKYINNPENELISTQEIDQLKFQVQYRPVEYQMLNELNLEVIDADSFKLQTKSNQSSQFFLLRISSVDVNVDPLRVNLFKEEQYQQRISYLIASIKDDIKLIDGKDTLACRMHHYERSYQLANFYNILLMFDNPSMNADGINDKTILLNDRIFELGKLNFNIKHQAIQNIPQILI